MKKVLISGATGFVGSNLTLRCLDEGYEVHVIFRESSDKWRLSDKLKDLKCYYTFMEDYEGLEKLIGQIRPDIIFHLAAYATYPFQEDVVKTINTNLLCTVNLLNASVKTGFESFINTGSSSEYGKKTHSMKETDIIEPNTLYAVTKSAGTLYCSNVGKTKNLSVATLRLFSVYGDFEEPGRLIPSVLSACMRGDDIKLANANAVRDFIYIDDVIDMYLKVANTKNLNGIILNVGTGSQHSVGDVVKICKEISNSDSKPIWGSRDGRPFDTDFWVADTNRAKLFLDWEAKFDLRRGIDKTFSWFRKDIDRFGYKYVNK